jgi:hypothetical protein
MTRAATFLRHHREFEVAWRQWQNRHKIAYLLMPRGLQTDPGAAYLYEVGLYTELGIHEKLDDPNNTTVLVSPVVPSTVAGRPSEPPPNSPTAPSTSSGMWLPDWRTVLVSFVAGMFFMGVVLLQWREWSRRRGLAQARRELTG